MFLIVFVGPALLIVWIITAIHRNNMSGLKEIPNAHFSVPYSRLWLLSTRYRELENCTRIRLHRCLGPVVRLGPRELSVNCIEDGIRTIYSAKFDKDPAFYHALVDQTDFMVTMIGNEEHKKRRRMLSHPYANSSILNSQALDSILSHVSRRLRAGMVGWAITGTSVDVYQQAKCCMLDIISGFLFGCDNATDTLQEPGFQNDLTNLAEASSKNLHMQISRDCLDWPMTYFASFFGSKVLPDLGSRDRWQAWLTRMITDSHKRHTTKFSSTASLFDYFYDSFKAADPDMPLNDMASFIAVECDDHLSAAHIGLGILLSYTMYELSRAPYWQRALREELLIVAEPSDQSLANRLANLPVLDAIVTETMRFHAPCPGPFPRIVPDSGCRLVGAFDIPAGTVVSASAWALHFNPIPFPSPEEWRPVRWLEADEKTLAEMRKWIWTFGSGARVCIGTYFSSRGKHRPVTVPHFRFIEVHSNVANGKLVIKEVLFNIYRDFETLVDEEYTGNVEQQDAFSSSPVAGCLKLKFRQLK